VSATKRLVVAINPSASFGKGSSVGPAVVQTLRALGHEVTSLQEPDIEQLMASARAAVARKPDALIVVGGDGMVNLGTNLLAGTKVPLAIVPSGTGNDMARGLGIPHDNTEAAIAALLAALDRPARAIDAGRMSFLDPETEEPTTRWFASAVSAGFDSVVNERANRMSRPKGASRYTIALVLELFRLSPITYRLVLDGVELHTKALLVTVGNNVSIGGGMKVTPDALIDDGLFDVLVVRPLPRLSFIRIFPRVFKGTHVTDPRVTIHRVSTVRIESDTAVAYADGERLGPLPIEVTVVPRALRLLA
jgi:diacylglycerol kinase (ATP)